MNNNMNISNKSPIQHNQSPSQNRGGGDRHQVNKHAVVPPREFEQSVQSTQSNQRTPKRTPNRQIDSNDLSLSGLNNEFIKFAHSPQVAKVAKATVSVLKDIFPEPVPTKPKSYTRIGYEAAADLLNKTGNMLILGSALYGGYEGGKYGTTEGYNYARDSLPPGPYTPADAVSNLMYMGACTGGGLVEGGLIGVGLGTVAGFFGACVCYGIAEGLKEAAKKY